MSLTSLLARKGAVLIRVDGSSDSFGNPVPTFTPSPAVGYWSQPLTGDEINLDESLQTGDERLFLGPLVIITGRDRWRDDQGQVWEVIGPPLAFSTPRGGPHHLELIIRLFNS